MGSPTRESHPVTGILYDCTGPHGVFWKAWKRCFKFQVTEKDMGDLYALGGTCAEVRVVHPARLWVFDPAGEPKKIAEANLPGAAGGNRAVHLPGDFEKPPGEWNTLELFVLGRTAVHVLNGQVVLVVQNASTIDGPELTETPLTGGQLQIQSEEGASDVSPRRDRTHHRTSRRDQKGRGALVLLISACPAAVIWHVVTMKTLPARIGRYTLGWLAQRELRGEQVLIRVEGAATANCASCIAPVSSQAGRIPCHIPLVADIFLHGANLAALRQRVRRGETMDWNENSRRSFLEQLGAAGTLALTAANVRALASPAGGQAQGAAGSPTNAAAKPPA